jgi:glycyl-tRNA synthetase
VLSKAYVEEKLEDGTVRTALNLPAFLAPVKVAVLPLLKKDGLPEKAREIMELLKFDHACIYDEKDTIGKRYRRQDAIGTPICITIDHQTLEDNTVTLRHRDTMVQDRINIDALAKMVDDKVSFKKALMKLQVKPVSVE